MKKITKINLFLVSFLIVIALIVSYSPLGFKPVASAAANCNTPSTSTPNLYIFPGGGSITGYIQPAGIKTNIGYIIDECTFNLNLPTNLTGGLMKPYPDWVWRSTYAGLLYANLNQNGLASCIAGQPGCSVISNVAATSYGNLVSSTTGQKEGFFVLCMSYAPNPPALNPQTLEWDYTNHVWLYEGVGNNTVSTYCDSKPTLKVDPSTLQIVK